MAKQNLNTIKNWFKTGLKPSQAQFWDVWDSFWHKDQDIPTGSIAGLNEILTDKASMEYVDNSLSDFAINKADVVDTIAQLEAYAGIAINIIVNDSLRGGSFYLDSGTSDNGVRFPATGKGSGVWIRVIQSKYANPLWWGADPTGINNSSPAIQAAINFGNGVFVPKGHYRVQNTIYLQQSNFIGSSSNSTTFDVEGGISCFQIDDGSFHSRNAATLANFAIMSTTNTCDNNYAIYAPGHDASGTLAYNSGLTIRDIEIGGGGGSRMGGGIKISSMMRVRIIRIGLSSVRNPICLVGSVVGVSLSDIIANFDFAPVVSTLPSVGLILEPRTYNVGILGVESVTTRSCTFAGYDTGMSYSGLLYNSFSELDLDYCKNYGVVMNGHGIVERSYIASSSSTKFIGILVLTSDDTNPIKTCIKDNIFNAYTVLPDGSTAIQYGDGGEAPYVETLGGNIEGNVIQSYFNGAWHYGINADRNKGMRIVSNMITHSSCRGTGIIATYSRNTIIEDNYLGEAIILFDSPFVGYCHGSIKRNIATVVIGSNGIVTPENWDFGPEKLNYLHSSGGKLDGPIKYSGLATGLPTERWMGSDGGSGLFISSPANIGFSAIEYVFYGGPVKVTQYRLSALNTAPATSTSPGVLGEIRITSTYIYICIAINTWVRSALIAW